MGALWLLLLWAAGTCLLPTSPHVGGLPRETHPWRHGDLKGGGRQFVPCEAAGSHSAFEPGNRELEWQQVDGEGSCEAPALPPFGVTTLGERPTSHEDTSEKYLKTQKVPLL